LVDEVNAALDLVKSGSREAAEALLCIFIVAVRQPCQIPEKLLEYLAEAFERALERVSKDDRPERLGAELLGRRRGRPTHQNVERNRLIALRVAQLRLEGLARADAIGAVKEELERTPGMTVDESTVELAYELHEEELRGLDFDVLRSLLLSAQALSALQKHDLSDEDLAEMLDNEHLARILSAEERGRRGKSRK
jgi:hypothetical protein